MMKPIVFVWLSISSGCLISCQTDPRTNKKLSTKETMMTDSTHSTNPYYSRHDTTPLRLSDEEWKRVLPDSIYSIARKQGTERAFTGQYWNFTGLGTYYCAACGNQLFRSDAKFASTCGWPSFFETVRPHSVEYRSDESHGMARTEVLCGRCESHLGHVFNDGPPPTHKRFCMNSLVLDFEPDSPAEHLSGFSTAIPSGGNK